MFTNSLSPSRRQRVRAAAMGIAVAGAASLFPGVPAAAVTSEAIRPFRINVPEDDLVICAGALPRPDGPIRKPSPISRKVHSWPSCRNWFATGAAATTGVRWKRS